MKHVGSSQDRSAFLIETHIRSKQIPIAAQYFFCFRIPYDQLLIWMFHSVIFIYIHRQPRSSTGSTKSDFTQTTDFPHYIGCILISNNINLIITFIRHSQAFVFRQLRLQQLFAYRFNNLFHISCYIQCLSRTPPTVPEFSIYRKSARVSAYRKLQ